MPHPLILLLAFSLFSANLYADTDREVYDEADGIFKQAEEAVGMNLATFVQANEKPLAKAREEMAELIARMNKEGRSQLATSLQKRLNGLEETVQKRVRTEVPIVVPPKKPLLERMEGKWEWGNAVLIVEGAGDAIYAEKDGSKVYCRGRVTGVSPNRAKIDWACPHWFIHVVDDDTLISFEGGWDSTRNGRLFERVR